MKLRVYHGIKNHLKKSHFLLKKIFLKIISQNRDYIQTYCNDCRNPFHIACREWYKYNNPHILT